MIETLSSEAPIPKREESRTRALLRGFRHALFLFFAGVLAREYFDQPHLIPVPDGSNVSPIEELTPKERRYREQLASLVQEITQRWPESLEDAQVRKGGALSANKAKGKASPEGIYQQQRDGAALTISFDRTGTVTHLHEEQKGKTIELWPGPRDLRVTLTDENRTEYAWWAGTDSLHGIRSSDGTLRSLFIEGEGIIDPSRPPLVLAQKLRTPHRLFLFQEIFGTYQDQTFMDPTGKVDPVAFGNFFQNFRLSFAEWQKGGYTQGSCNTYAETACEVLSQSPHERYPMHILTYWPADLKKRFRDPWHSTAAYPMANGEWCIIDDAMRTLTYVPSPEIYGKRWDLELASTPVLGRFPWKAEPGGPAFRFLQLLHIPEMKEK